MGIKWLNSDMNQGQDKKAFPGLPHSVLWHLFALTCQGNSMGVVIRSRSCCPQHTQLLDGCICFPPHSSLAENPQSCQCLFHAKSENTSPTMRHNAIYLLFALSSDFSSYSFTKEEEQKKKIHLFFSLIIKITLINNFLGNSFSLAHLQVSYLA